MPKALPKRVLLGAAAAATLLMTTAGGAQAQKVSIDFDACRENAIKHLEANGIQKTDVTDYSYVGVTEGGRGGLRIVSVDFWLRVQQCTQGSVTVSLTRTCRVREAFTRGGCEIEGLRSFR